MQFVLVLASYFADTSAGQARGELAEGMCALYETAAGRAVTTPRQGDSWLLCFQARLGTEGSRPAILKKISQ